MYRSKVPSGELLVRWAPLAAWLAAIFVFSSLPGHTLESTSEEIRNTSPAPFIASVLTHQATVHSVEYGVLAVLLYRLLSSYRRLSLAPLWGAVLVVATAYALSDELHQAFVPGRSASLLDVGYDVLGSAAGIFVAEATVRLWSRLSRSSRRTAEALNA